MEGVLPAKVQQRVHKSNLSPNFNRKLLQAEKSILRQIVQHPQRIKLFVDMVALQNAYQRYASQVETKPEAQSSDAVNIFSAAVLELWLQQTGEMI